MCMTTFDNHVLQTCDGDVKWPAGRPLGNCIPRAAKDDAPRGMGSLQKVVGGLRYMMKPLTT